MYRSCILSLQYKESRNYAIEMQQFECINMINVYIIDEYVFIKSFIPVKIVDDIYNVFMSLLHWSEDLSNCQILRLNF